MFSSNFKYSAKCENCNITQPVFCVAFVHNCSKEYKNIWPMHGPRATGQTIWSTIQHNISQQVYFYWYCVQWKKSHTLRWHAWNKLYLMEEKNDLGPFVNWAAGSSVILVLRQQLVNSQGEVNRKEHQHTADIAAALQMFFVIFWKKDMARLKGWLAQCTLNIILDTVLSRWHL